METFKENIKNLSKNKIYLILIGLAAIILATVLIYAYVEFLSDRIGVVPAEEGKPYCGAIGSRSEGWYINSDSDRPELIRWDKCEGCYAVCKAIGSRSEGWYSSCDGERIKWDNCGGGQEEGNLPPVIDGLTAPTQLKINEKGVWTIKARDPENGSLSYSVNWGDEYAKIALSESAPAKLDTRSQTTTFTHSYNRVGSYTIKFIVTDDHQQTTETSATVEVVSEIPEAICTDSDGGINKYVKGTTCREFHYSSSAAVSCKTDMCDGICYSQSTSTNLEGQESNITPSSYGDPTSTNLKNDHKVPSLPSYYKDFPPIEPPIPNNFINVEAPLVKEYYCENNRIMSKHIRCENGCKDGACIKEEQTCDAKCKSMNYKSGICRSWTVVPPRENWGCKENEKDVGQTSDCTTLITTINGIEQRTLGADKTCCCKIECNEKLNKEDCETVGGEYECACCSTHCECYCKCPCKTDSDCGVDRCDQGRDVCHELIYKCENGKCDYTSTKYKGYSCARYYDPESSTPEKCLDTCGDGVCKSPETKWWCPEDCKEETKPIMVTSPNGGEKWVETSTRKITWKLNKEEISSNDKVGIYLVDYSRDGAECNSQGCEPWKYRISTHQEYHDFPAYPSEFLWNVPFADPLSEDKYVKAGDKFKIRIGEIINAQGDIGDYDESDNYFSIVKMGDVSCRNANYPCSIEGIPCCPGLKSSALFGDPNGDCSTVANCGTICIPCGNGVCDANEGKCNCPEDCEEGGTLSADLNCDGNVNLTDFAILLSFWGKDPSGSTSCKSPDINQDGKVNLADFSVIMSQWTK